MNLNLVVKQFFEENDYHKIADKIIVLRKDGICIYSNISDQNEAASMGALIGGVWQAAQALSQLTHKTDSYQEYRLGFDTSSDGLYILPICIKSEDYYIGGVYSDAYNPAKLKQKIKMLKDNLEVYLAEYAPTAGDSNEEEKEDFLFDEISDEEMDNLFSFGGV